MYELTIYSIYYTILYYAGNSGRSDRGAAVSAAGALPGAVRLSARGQRVRFLFQVSDTAVAVHVLA